MISDRIMILQRLHLLSNILKDQNILNWEFFLSRFDALSLEAQIDLENSGELSCLTGYNDYNKLSGNGPLKFVAHASCFSSKWCAVLKSFLHLECKTNNIFLGVWLFLLDILKSSSLYAWIVISESNS